jgi:1-acyl-sn-glycerol-3-phosphate acyltransferase
LGTVIASNKVLPLDKKFPSFGHTVHVIFGDPIHPGQFESVPELLDEVQLRITTLEVPR